MTKRTHRRRLQTYRPTRPELFQKLAGQRQMMSLVEQEILASAGVFCFDKADWVKLWCDTGNVVTSDCGRITAYRAITLDGTLLWYVFHDSKKRGFHAGETDPFAAIEAAKDAWARRRQIRARWDEVESIATDLRKGRQKFDVLVSDAHRSPLCSFGIKGFLTSIGMGRANGLNGRLAGVLMKLEPQLGFAIYEAWKRVQAEGQVRARTDPKGTKAAI